MLHPTAAEVYTCWNTQSAARQLNYGTRIDYVLCDAAAAAAGLARSCDVLAEVQGSDHCPVRAAVAARLIPAGRPPPACTRYYPELAGRQLTIKQWCARPQPAEKRPPPPASTGQRQGKRPRGGQATLLGFVRRAAPTKDSRSGGSDLEKDSRSGDPDRTVNNGETPPEGNSEAEISDAVSGGTAAWDRLCDSDTIDRTEQVAELANGTADSSQSSPGEADISRQKAAAAASFWSETLRAVRPPTCRGHREPCVQRVVKKAGPNLGKQFWCCARGVGKPGDPEARCGHFEWLRRGGRLRASDVTAELTNPVPS